MSLYRYYFDYNNSVETNSNNSKSSNEVPDYDCTWSFLDTPELLLSDTDDGSSCGGEDVYKRGKKEISTSWTGQFVQFGRVRVREYLRWQGDHPSCRDRYALTIGWCHGPECVYMVDDYEAKKRRKRRRKSGSKSGMAQRLDPFTRRQLLNTDYAADPDMELAESVGIECMLEMEMPDEQYRYDPGDESSESEYGDETSDDMSLNRWGAYPGRDDPIEPRQRGDSLEEVQFTFPSNMMKVQILED